jgi:cobalt-precorrin-5B (C1)-methyltransferase
MLVTAAAYSVKSILLWGYHGKLIKLAGGIFHTHHHLADGRLEILISHGVKVGIPLSTMQNLWQCPTIKAAVEQLKQEEKGEEWLKLLYQSLGETIDRRCQTYIYQHSEKRLKIGSGMFDSDRKIVYLSQMGQKLIQLN